MNRDSGTLIGRGKRMRAARPALAATHRASAGRCRGSWQKNVRNGWVVKLRVCARRTHQGQGRYAMV